MGRVIIRKIPASRLPACKPFYFISLHYNHYLIFCSYYFLGLRGRVFVSGGPKGFFQGHGLMVELDQTDFHGVCSAFMQGSGLPATPSNTLFL